MLCDKYTNVLKGKVSILPSSGLLHGVRLFETDVSGPPIGRILQGEDVFLDILNLEDGTDM